MGEQIYVQFNTEIVQDSLIFGPFGTVEDAEAWATDAVLSKGYEGDNGLRAFSLFSTRPIDAMP